MAPETHFPACGRVSVHSGGLRDMRVFRYGSPAFPNAGSARFGFPVASGTRVGA